MGGGQFEQRDLGGAENETELPPQGPPDAELARLLHDGINADLATETDRNGVPGQRERLRQRDRAEKFMVGVVRPEVAIRYGRVRSDGPGIESRALIAAAYATGLKAEPVPSGCDTYSVPDVAALRYQAPETAGFLATPLPCL